MDIKVIGGLLAIALSWYVWGWLRLRLFYDMHNIPGPRPWPLVGNLPQLAGTATLHKIQARWAKQYGPVVKFFLGPTAALLITDPQDLQNITSQEAKLPKWSKLYDLLNARAPHYSMLGTPDYEEWRYIRKMTNPAFSPQNLRQIFHKVHQTALQAAEVVREVCQSGPVDVDALALSITAEVIMTTAFDHDMGFLKTETDQDGKVKLLPHTFLKYQKDYQDNMNLMFNNPLLAMLVAIWPWHPQAKKAKAANKVVAQKEDELTALIKERGVQPETNTALWACLSRLVNYKDGTPIHHDTLATNVGLFFGAGYESSGHAVTWALFELAANQTLQRDVQQELKAAGLMASEENPNTRQLEWADLTKLPLLDGVVKETLRMHGTLPLNTARVTTSAMVIGGYRVPKGTPMMAPSYPIHASADNYVKPDKFWPERWLEATDGSTLLDKEHPNATLKGNRHYLAASWTPFSLGNRNCIGQSLALQEIRTVLAVFMANFRFELPAGVSRDKFLEDEQVLWISLQPRAGLPLVTTPISNAQGWQCPTDNKLSAEE